MGRSKGHGRVPKRGRLNPKAEEQPPLELENAFMNPLVLNTVFSFLKEEEDLMSCRLVNSTWNQEVIPYLKVCCNIIDIQAPSAEEPSSGEYLQQLVNRIRSSEDFPFTKFIISQSRHLNGSGPEWNSLMETLAPFTREVFFWCDPTLPSLTLPEEIHFPELRRLDIVWSVNLNSYFIPKIVDNSPRLNYLGLNDPQLPLLETLRSNKNLKLADLYLLFLENPQSTEHFLAHYNLLQSQGANLEKLDITKNRQTPKHNQRISVDSSPLSFPKLKRLKLHNVQESFLGDLLGGREKGFHFAARFPVLKFLSVDLRESDFRDCLQSGPPATSVQELEMFSYMDGGTHRLVLELENVPRLFPKLTSLATFVKYENLWRLVEGLECLEKLKLYSRFTTSELDQIFTGLSVEECELMQGLTKRQFQEKWRNLNNRNPLESSPRSALHKIWELSLSVKDFGVSDVSCRLVFLQMRNLKILKLKGDLGSFAQISGSVRKEMTEKFQQEIFIYN